MPPKSKKLATQRRSCDRCRQKKLACIPFDEDALETPRICRKCLELGLDCMVNGKPFQSTLEINEFVTDKSCIPLFPDLWFKLEKVKVCMAKLELEVGKVDFLIQYWFETKSWMYNIVFKRLLRHWYCQYTLLTASILVGVLGTKLNPCPVKVDRRKVVELHEALMDALYHILLVSALQKEPEVPLILLLEAMLASMKSGYGTDERGFLNIRAKLSRYAVLHGICQFCIAKWRLFELDVEMEVWPNRYLEELNDGEWNGLLLVWREMLRRFIWDHPYHEVTWYFNLNEPCRFPFKYLTLLKVPCPDEWTKEGEWKELNWRGEDVGWILLDKDDEKRRFGLERLKVVDLNLVNVVYCLCRVIVGGVADVVTDGGIVGMFAKRDIESSQRLNWDGMSFWSETIDDVLGSVEDFMSEDVDIVWKRAEEVWATPTAAKYFLSLIQLYDVKMRLQIWLPGMELVPELCRLSDDIRKEIAEVLGRESGHLTRLPSVNVKLKEGVGSVQLLQDVELVTVMSDLICLSRLFAILVHGCRLNPGIFLGHGAFTVALRALFVHSQVLWMLNQEGYSELADESSQDLKLCGEFLLEVFKRVLSEDAARYFQGFLVGRNVGVEEIRMVYLGVTQDIYSGRSKAES